jgi:hypothetical protein
MLFLKAMPSFAQMFGLQLMPLPLVPVLNRNNERHAVSPADDLVNSHRHASYYVGSAPSGKSAGYPRCASNGRLAEANPMLEPVSSRSFRAAGNRRHFRGCGHVR